MSIVAPVSLDGQLLREGEEYVKRHLRRNDGASVRLKHNGGQSGTEMTGRPETVDLVDTLGLREGTYTAT